MFNICFRVLRDLWHGHKQFLFPSAGFAKEVVVNSLKLKFCVHRQPRRRILKPEEERKMKTDCTHGSSGLLNNLFSVFWLSVIFFVCHFQPGYVSSSYMYYQSVQWAPENSRFQFSKEQIQDGKAYYRLCVLPNYRLPFVCPNPSTYLSDIQDKILVDKLYENIWYVDKESFQACKVGSPKAKGINQKLLNCDNPSVLKYDLVVFAPISASSDLVFLPGTEHYFIGTSNGSQNSLDSKSGGHCSDAVNGIAMKMLIYICYNDTDPVCTVKTDSPTETTSQPVSTASTIKPDLATQALRTSPSNNIWHLLTIIFGVGFACCLVILSLCLIVVCYRKTPKQPIGERDKLHPHADVLVNALPDITATA